ncbi:hypothetical protein Scep_002371 [Stephania cephalantha]|uniref:40S ribosomal protein S17 n=1 Tax=Stephania cephalantha TaxID=152367 RepID=A0AAP0LAW5_9MAGN
MASYPHNYGRFEDSHYYNVNGENVNVDTLRNVEVNEVTPVENYWCETTQGLEVLQIESDISIAHNDDDEVGIEIGVISERPEEPQIESKEDQPLVLVKPPTFPCIFVKPYMGVEVKERSQIFYTDDTFMLDDHDMTYSFVIKEKYVKRIRNKIAGFTTHLMKRIQRGPVRGISLKLQEEEREHRIDFVPDESAIKTDLIEVDRETLDMLAALGMADMHGVVVNFSCLRHIIHKHPPDLRQYRYCPQLDHLSIFIVVKQAEPATVAAPAFDRGGCGRKF